MSVKVTEALNVGQSHWSIECRSQCVLKEYAKDNHYVRFDTLSYHCDTLMLS